jgi:hypothetical protein
VQTGLLDSVMLASFYNYLKIMFWTVCWELRPGYDFLKLFLSMRRAPGGGLSMWNIRGILLGYENLRQKTGLLRLVKVVSKINARSAHFFPVSWQP